MATYTKRGKTWRATITRKGHARESLTFDSKSEAVQWAAEREAAILGGAAPKSVQAKRTVTSMLDEYIATVTSRVDPVTGKDRRKDTVRLEKFKRTLPFRNKAVGDVTTRDVDLWRDALHTEVSEYTHRVLTPWSILRDFGLLRSVFARAVRWRWIATSPFAGAECPPKGDERKRKWSDMDVRKVCLALGYNFGSTPETRQQHIAWAILFALETAARRGEILQSTHEMIDYKKRTYAMPAKITKGRRARDIPLSKEALALLKVAPTKSGPLLPGLTEKVCDQLVRRAVKRAGCGDLHFHDTRRTATTRLADIYDVLQLAAITGHADLQLLKDTYYAPDITSLAEKMDRAPKRKGYGP